MATTRPLDGHFTAKSDPSEKYLAVYCSPIQPHCHDICALNKRPSERMTYIGSTDIAGTLAFSTVDEGVQDTEDHIDVLAHDPGGCTAVALLQTDVEDRK